MFIYSMQNGQWYWADQTELKNTVSPVKHWKLWAYVFYSGCEETAQNIETNKTKSGFNCFITYDNETDWYQNTEEIQCIAVRSL